MAGLICAAGAVLPATAAENLDDAGCLTCHDGKKGKIEVPTPGDDKRALDSVDLGKLQKSLHGQMTCVACHKEITDSKANHQKAKDVKPATCTGCHETLWESIKNSRDAQKKDRLETVVKNIAAYKESFHARPDKDNPWRPKAICNDCHSSHYFAVPPKGTPQREVWRKEVPKICGKCHDDQLESYTSSIHGEEALEKGNAKSAVCIDCHTTHEITNTSSDKFKLANVNACGNCHDKQLKSYTDTYHGQVNRLGFAYTARCSDCHSSHDIFAADNSDSTISPKNRLKTCQKCHNDKKPGMHQATAGFVTFAPHANTHDFKKYPEMYITSKFMVALLIGVFAFFWSHSLLWFYREWQDRRQGNKTEQHVNVAALGIDPTKHFERFHWGWRISHLTLVLAVMTLVLTGTTVLYAQSSWAPIVAKALGGPKVMGLAHRIAAATFVVIFLGHLAYVLWKLVRAKNFRWFGPDSMLPNWKDLADCIGMFKWFFGMGPKPQFERFTYFEKFDYWAVFWGVNIIGWSGLMLAIPHVTAQYLPGWVFNVATLFHGEEAFLAAVFLFTVHFFNNHFRPNKLPPPDIVMFTGTQSLHEFIHEHPAQYQRLVESGEIKKYLVDAPSPAMKVGSTILGLTLLTVGLTLLALVSVGFFSAL